MFVRNQYLLCVMLSNLFNHFNVCILTSLLHIYDTTGHYCIFVCCVPPRRWPKKAETRRKITTCLFTVVSNFSVDDGVCMMIYLSERNMDNFKLKYPSLLQEATNQYFVSSHCVPL